MKKKKTTYITIVCCELYIWGQVINQAFNDSVTFVKIYTLYALNNPRSIVRNITPFNTLRAICCVLLRR